jgi:hypothetical protein
MLIKTLKWPVISLLITGATHFTLEAIWPSLKDLFVAPSLAPLLLAFGIWTGYKAIHNGGNYLSAILAGVILGVLPLGAWLHRSLLCRRLRFRHDPVWSTDRRRICLEQERFKYVV